MKRLSHSLLAVALVCGSAMGAQAQGAGDSEVVSAAELLNQGEYEAAERTIRKALLGMVEERAEAFRVLGLSLFYQERHLEARAAFLDYLRSDPDAHLDPALVPPEAITLFEDVRARNLVEIESLRPKPKKNRYLALNLVPGAGQYQNGERGKGIAIGAGLASLVAVHVGSYYWLRANCDNETRVCGDADGDDADTARSVQTINLLSGVGAIGLYAYSVIDGYVGYRSAERSENNPTPNHMRLGLLPVSDGVGLQMGARF